jgi:hypothetical protein
MLSKRSRLISAPGSAGGCESQRFAKAIPRQSLGLSFASMAREIYQREDLLRDAKALVPRAMLRVRLFGSETEVFVGFRGQSLSLYFGDDPVLHFNAQGELRRAFIADRLVKAEQGQLVSLQRQRSSGEVVLARVELNALQQEELLLDAARRLAELHSALTDNRWRLVGQIPEDGDAVARLGAWLDAPRVIVVAKSPRVEG